MRFVVLALGLGAFLACTTAPIGTYDQSGVNLPDRGTSTTTDGGSTGTSPGTTSTSTLTVTLVGSGTVTSLPAGLVCTGTTCTGTFPTGTPVSLTATPTNGASFTGWSGGGCTGTAACGIAVSGSVVVTATFGGVSGTWSGPYDHHQTLPGGCHFDNGGTLSTVLVAPDAGTSITSTATITGLQLKDAGNGAACTLQSTQNGTAAATTLTSTGTTLTGSWSFAVPGTGGQNLNLPFTATVNGSTLTGTWSCTGCTGSFTLTKQQ